MASPGVLESNISETSRSSQPAAERIDGGELLSLNAIHLLMKSVQNGIQFNERPALQSLQEVTSMAPSSSFTDSSQPLELESTVVAHGTSDILSQAQEHQNPSMSSQIENKENKSEGNNSAKVNDQPIASICNSHLEQANGPPAVEALSHLSEDLPVSTRRSQMGHTIENGSQNPQTEPSQIMAIQSEPDRSRQKIPFNNTSCFNPGQNMNQENINIQRGYLQDIQSMHHMAYHPPSAEDSLHSFASNCILNNSLGIPTGVYPLEELQTELYPFGEDPIDLYNFDILTNTVCGSSHSDLGSSAFSGNA